MIFERDLRLWELSAIVSLLPAKGRILEIGAGAGWQGEALRQDGYRVTSIDLPGSTYRSYQRSSVVQYDGSRMPFADDCFECLFSSNVLEHVQKLEAFQAEALRVLKSEGIAVHLMPTAMWRFWTLLSHYLFLLKHLAEKTYRFCRSRSTPLQTLRLDTALSKYGWRELFWRAALPERHGAVGAFLTELYYFGRFRWRRSLARAGWRVDRVFPARLFYTGYLILDAWLPIRVRHLLSYILGSSCLVYVLRPEPQPDPE